jgi:hypothetical protein
LSGGTGGHGEAAHAELICPFMKLPQHTCPPVQLDALEHPNDAPWQVPFATQWVTPPPMQQTCVESHDVAASPAPHTVPPVVASRGPGPVSCADMLPSTGVPPESVPFIVPPSLSPTSGDDVPPHAAPITAQMPTTPTTNEARTKVMGSSS